ncbi:hypothetical protein M8C13_08815 [Crossiella sp. SN42]|uniref:hypothetical protein n=1 Tax=Crossiella sp. SN42 TaxID=2944808 RepID=UPI00207C28F7|nr:hypothetical protein [Crossiella sp. SN42]MCO1575857.1 hypothetical protein [Crossiella sp. SN42]
MEHVPGAPSETIVLSLGDLIDVEFEDRPHHVPQLTVLAARRRLVIAAADPTRFTRADLEATERLRRALQFLYDQGFRYLSARGELPRAGAMPPFE